MGAHLDRPLLKSRRDWLSAVIGVLTTILGGSAFAGIIAYLIPSRRKGSAVGPIDVAAVDEFEPWESKKIDARSEPIIVVRTDEDYVAVTATCTHLGCLVQFDPGKRQFVCPCHGGAFDLSGQRVAGPPPEPLRLLPVTVSNGRVFVTA